MSSPSEFLTFYRRVATQSLVRNSIRTSRAAPLAIRPFSVAPYRMADKPLSTDDSVKTDQYPDSEHATRKKDKLDVQSEYANRGQECVYHFSVSV